MNKPQARLKAITTNHGWTAWQLLRHFGPRWLAYRTKYALARRSGWLARRETIRQWDDVPLSQLLIDDRLADPQRLADHLRTRDVPFFFSPAELNERRLPLARFDEQAAAADENPVAKAGELARGEFRLFHGHRRELGLPPNWHRNALSGETAPADLHWSRIGDFDYGDIKAIWDLSRFSFAFDLMRAYARTGDQQWPELFWSLLEDWRLHNPPNHGANWKCGQEASLRLLAWCFGLFAFLDCPSSTPDRIAQLVQMIGFSGGRIESNINYAASQKNNHGVSEATGLWTLGLLFPEFRSAERFRQCGGQTLQKLARELIYDDGSFAQHSWNYHRLMLHDYIWAIRLGEINGRPLDEAMRRRVAGAGELLGQMIDENTGGVPCYGQDDGSLILPLNNCSYFDYRPVVQATAAVTSGVRRYESGPWDEDLLWLLGPSYETLPIEPLEQKDAVAPHGGYVVLRSESSSLFTRAASFHHRPAQADMLHVDVWWRGKNIAIDPGAFSYNAPPPWNNPLATAAYHNTVTVDGMDQMTRTGRFVWLPWLSGRQSAPQYSKGHALCYWQGQHDGYTRLPGRPIHQRGILRIGAEHWLILDRLECQGQHAFRVHWLLADLPHEFSEAEGRLTLHVEGDGYDIRVFADQARYSLVRADDVSPRGWRARGYQQREPALSLSAEMDGRSALFCTLIGPANTQLDAGKESIQLAGPGWQAEVSLADAAAELLISQATITGHVKDDLVISS